MGLFTDSVARDLYERECHRADAAEARVDSLIKEMLRLKKKGYEGPHDAKPGRVTPASPSADELAAKRLHDEMIDNVAKELEQMPGVDPAKAKAEAQRLRGLISGGSVTEPPI